jgi:hypothetical protein
VRQWLKERGSDCKLLKMRKLQEKKSLPDKAKKPKLQKSMEDNSDGHGINLLCSRCNCVDLWNCHNSLNCNLIGYESNTCCYHCSVCNNRISGKQCLLGIINIIICRYPGPVNARLRRIALNSYYVMWERNFRPV